MAASNSSSSPRTVQSVLPPYLCPIIPYKHFTRMQSESLDTWNDNKNILVCAPTSSGKSVCFELAILRLVHHSLQHSPRKQLEQNGLPGKAVYLSPTKSLCTEKAEEWAARLSPLGVRVEVVTGDAQASANDERVLNADVILTTAEKLDSLMRDSPTLAADRLAAQTVLLLLDEVHHVGDTRGATLEAVVTRLIHASHEAAASGSMGGLKLPISALRIVAASATIGNVSEVAHWLRVPRNGLLTFGEEYRPIALDYVVRGYYASNTWQFAKVYDKNLLKVVTEHGSGKPTIVFCTSRAQTATSAQALTQQLNSSGREVMRFGNTLTRYLTMEQRQSLSDVARNSGDVLLRSVLPSGIGIHNADMSASSRQLVERLFKQCLIRCLFSTSTLAQGVNLPARLVIICGTSVYRDGGFQEYDGSQVLQMCGRAGRAGLDQRGVAVIMTARANVRRYENVQRCVHTIESQMTGRIEEWMNREIARQDVHDVSTAVSLLINSFYWRRRQTLGVGNGGDSEDERRRVVTDVAVSALRELSRTKLITFDGDGFGVSCTQLGQCMAMQRLSFATVKRLAKELPHVSTPTAVLWLIGSVEEMTEGVIVRRGEKTRLNELNGLVRLPVQGKVKEAVDKICVVIQAALAGDSISSSMWGGDCALRREAERLLSTAHRVCGAMVEIAVEQAVRVPFEAVLAVLQVSRSVMCRWSWDNVSALRHLCSIKEDKARDFARHGARTVHAVAAMSAHKIAETVGMGIGAAQQILQNVGRLPLFTVECVAMRENGRRGRIMAVEVNVTVKGASKRPPGSKETAGCRGYVMIGSHARGLMFIGRFNLEDGGCRVFCDGMNEGGGEGKGDAGRAKGRQGRQHIDVIVGCDTVIGMDVSERLVDDDKGGGEGKNLSIRGRPGAQFRATRGRISKPFVMGRATGRTKAANGTTGEDAMAVTDVSDGESDPDEAKITHATAAHATAAQAKAAQAKATQVTDDGERRKLPDATQKCKTYDDVFRQLF